MSGHELDISSSFTQLGLSVSSNLSWKTQAHSIAKHASQKLGFLSRARGFFSPSQLLTIYKSQILPSLEYCSHVWGGAPRSSLHLLYKVQSKAIRLINNPSLTKSLQSLSHCRLVADLSILYRFCHGHCSLEIKNIIPDPLKHVRPLEALLSHTLSKSHYLIHELFPANLHSFQDPVNLGTPYLPLPFLNPTTYLASNLISTNLISSP